MAEGETSREESKKDEGRAEDQKTGDGTLHKEDTPSSPGEETQPGEDAQPKEEINLDKVDTSGTKTPKLRDIETSEFISVPYDINKAQENTRGKITIFLLSILSGVIILSFIYLWCLPLSERTKDYTANLITILQIVFGPVVTLVGTAVGYYFGIKNESTNSRKSDSDEKKSNS